MYFSTAKIKHTISVWYIMEWKLSKFSWIQTCENLKATVDVVQPYLIRLDCHTLQGMQTQSILMHKMLAIVFVVVKR